MEEGMKKEARLEQHLRQACWIDTTADNCNGRKTWKLAHTTERTQLWRASIGFVKQFTTTVAGFSEFSLVVHENNKFWRH